MKLLKHMLLNRSFQCTEFCWSSELVNICVVKVERVRGVCIPLVADFLCSMSNYSVYVD